MENISPFYVGQRVVAIANHEGFKKGDEFIVKAIRESQCSCPYHEISVSIKPTVYLIGYSRCSVCGQQYRDDAEDWFFDVRHFAPIHENFQSISLSKILEEETKLIGVN